MDPVAALFLILFGILFVVLALGLLARREQRLFVAGVSLAEVADIVRRSAKGPVWAVEDGPGELNFRRRTPISIRGSKGPTLSARFQAGEDGTVEATLWMSAWTTLYGVVNGGESILFRRWKITRALRRGQGVGDVRELHAVPRPGREPLRPASLTRVHW